LFLHLISGQQQKGCGFGSSLYGLAASGILVFQRDPSTIMTLSGAAPPPLGHPPVAMTMYFLKSYSFRRNASRPPAGYSRGGDSIQEQVFSRAAFCHLFETGMISMPACI
jgi:hypothetical protein